MYQRIWSMSPRLAAPAGARDSAEGRGDDSSSLMRVICCAWSGVSYHGPWPAADLQLRSEED